MTDRFHGPSLIVHILIVAMGNGLLFPWLYAWVGSILYAFLISVGLLTVYGMIAIRIAGGRKR